MPIEQYKFRLYLLDSSFCEIVLDRFFATKNIVKCRPRQILQNLQLAI